MRNAKVSVKNRTERDHDVINNFSRGALRFSESVHEVAIQDHLQEKIL